MSFRPGSKAINRTEQFNTLFLVGGKNCDTSSDTFNLDRESDLRVVGGATIQQDICVGGKLRAMGNIDAQSMNVLDSMVANMFLGNVLATNTINEKEIGQGITVNGNLFFGDFVSLNSNIIEFNANDVNITENLTVCGDQTLKGNLIVMDMASFADDVWIINQLNVGGDTTFSSDVCINADLKVTGNLMANIMNMVMAGNIVEANVFVASQKVETNKIESEDGSGNVCLSGNLIITDTLFVSDIVGVDIGAMLDGNVLTSNTFCANIKVQTDLIEPKGPNGNVNIDGNLIVNNDICIDNILYTGNLAGKSPINVLDHFEMGNNSIFDASRVTCGNISAKTGNVKVTIDDDLCVLGNIINCAEFDSNSVVYTPGIPAGLPISWDDTCAFITNGYPEQGGAVVWSPDLERWVVARSNLSRVMYSDDGVSWNITTSGVGSTAWKAGIWAKSQYWILTNIGAIMTSADGISWSTSTAVGTYVNWDIAYSPAQDTFVVVGWNSPYIKYSTNDGVSWNNATILSGAGTCYSVDWSPELGIFVATGLSGRIFTSPDGITWTQRVSGVTNSIGAVVWSSMDMKFVALCSNGAGLPVLNSTDGITWNNVANIFARFWNDVIFVPELNNGTGGYYACAYGNTSSNGATNIIAKSDDGIVWTAVTTTVSTLAYQMGYSQKLGQIICATFNTNNNRNNLINPVFVTEPAVKGALLNDTAIDPASQIMYKIPTITGIFETQTMSNTSPGLINIDFPNDGNYAHFDIFITAKINSSTIASYSFKDGFVINKSGTLSLVNPSKNVLIEDDALLDVDVNVVSTDLQIELTGINSAVEWDVIGKFYTNNLSI